MEIMITSDKQNALLNRRELEFTLNYSGPTPPRKKIHAKLAAIINTPKEQLVLDSLKNRFGMMQLIGGARAYQTREDLKRLESEHLLKRGKIEEDKADAEDAPAGSAVEAS